MDFGSDLGSLDVCSEWKGWSGGGAALEPPWERCPGHAQLHSNPCPAPAAPGTLCPAWNLPWGAWNLPWGGWSQAGTSHLLLLQPVVLQGAGGDSSPAAPSWLGTAAPCPGHAASLVFPAQGKAQGSAASVWGRADTQWKKQSWNLSLLPKRMGNGSEAGQKNHRGAALRKMSTGGRKTGMGEALGGFYFDGAFVPKDIHSANFPGKTAAGTIPDHHREPGERFLHIHPTPSCE